MKDRKRKSKDGKVDRAVPMIIKIKKLKFLVMCSLCREVGKVD